MAEQAIHTAAQRAGGGDDLFPVAFFQREDRLGQTLVLQTVTAEQRHADIPLRGEISEGHSQIFYGAAVIDPIEDRFGFMKDIPVMKERIGEALLLALVMIVRIFPRHRKKGSRHGPIRQLIGKLFGNIEENIQTLPSAVKGMGQRYRFAYIFH